MINKIFSVQVLKNNIISNLYFYVLTQTNFDDLNFLKSNFENEVQ